MGVLRSPRRTLRDEHGLVAVITALSMVVLLMVAAFVVDLGLARDTRRQSQNAADASALAGANVLYPASGLCTLLSSPATPPCFNDAVDAATAYALDNFSVSAADWAACTDPARYYSVPSRTQCISFTDDSLSSSKPSQPTRVKVKLPVRNVRTSLGGLAGVSNVPISSEARAMLAPGTARSCGLCILGTGISALGNGDVTVTGGSVHSNGTVDSGPNGRMTAGPPPNTISTSGTCDGNCSPAAIERVALIPDPYATLALPPTAVMASLSPKTNPCLQGPGIYPALELPNSLCVLSPGLYVMTGTWGMKNNTVLSGVGVTLYGTCGTPTSPSVCTNGQSGGALDTKNGETQLVAPLTGTLTGLAIIYDRLNTADLNIQGNGRSFVTGGIYAAKALLDFPGNSCVSVTNGPIIVDSLYGNGNRGCLNLTSLVGATIPAPPAGLSLDR